MRPVTGDHEHTMTDAHKRFYLHTQAVNKFLDAKGDPNQERDDKVSLLSPGVRLGVWPGLALVPGSGRMRWRVGVG